MATTAAGYAKLSRLKWLKNAAVVLFWLLLVKGILWAAAPMLFYYALQNQL